MTLSTTLVLTEQRISNYGDLTTIKSDGKLVLQEQITQVVKCFYCCLDTNSDLDVLRIVTVCPCQWYIWMPKGNMFMWLKRCPFHFDTVMQWLLFWWNAISHLFREVPKYRSSCTVCWAARTHNCTECAWLSRVMDYAGTASDLFSECAADAQISAPYLVKLWPVAAI